MPYPMIKRYRAGIKKNKKKEIDFRLSLFILVTGLTQREHIRDEYPYL